jgi:hypothetical protein
MKAQAEIVKGFGVGNLNSKGIPGKNEKRNGKTTYKPL